MRIYPPEQSFSRNGDFNLTLMFEKLGKRTQIYGYFENDSTYKLVQSIAAETNLTPEEILYKVRVAPNQLRTQKKKDGSNQILTLELIQNQCKLLQTKHEF